MRSKTTLAALAGMVISRFLKSVKSLYQSYWELALKALFVGNCMKQKTFLQNAVTALLILAVLAIPISLPVSGEGTTTTQVFFSNEVYIIPGASSGICNYAATMMPVTTGDILTGSLSSDNPGGVAFAIMSTNQYALGFLDPALNPGAPPRSGVSVFQKHTCTGLAGSSEYHNEGQSFQFQWTASAPDAYYLVMLNPNSAPNTVTLSVNRITTGGGIGYSRTGSTNSPTSHTSVYSSATESPTTSATSTPSTISPLTLSFDPMYVAIGVGVVVLVVFLLWQVRSSSRRKLSPQVSAPSEKQQTAQVTREGLQKQFCLNCGRQIPLGSRFCGKCGAAQT